MDNALPEKNDDVRSESNDPAPPLLMLPGTACDERVFLPVIARLGGYPVTVGTMTGASTTPELAARILVDAPEVFCLAGFSLGGIVALEIVAQAPERVAGLALIDTTPRPDPDPNAAARRAAVANARNNGMRSYITDSWERLVAPANLDDRHLLDTLCAMACDAGPDVLASQSEAAIHRADSRPRLKDIAVRTLVVRGESDEVCPLAVHRELADGIAGSRFVEVADAGHFAPLERPEEVAAGIRLLLAAVSGKGFADNRVLKERQ